MLENYKSMVVPSRKLFFTLLNIQHGMNNYLFNMVNEIFDERFLPIKVYDNELRWISILIWDNQTEVFHGPFEAEKEFSLKQPIINDYKWANGELYVYYEGGFDACVMGLVSGKVSFEEC